MLDQIDDLLNELIAAHTQNIFDKSSLESSADTEYYEYANYFNVHSLTPPVSFHHVPHVPHVPHVKEQEGRKRDVVYDSETHAQKAYEKLSKYPNPINALRYPKTYKTSNVSSRYNSGIHDLIYANMAEIVPNIDIGYHIQTLSPANLAEWIKSTKAYYNTMNNVFQKKCDDQMAKLNRIEDQKVRCTNFEIERINRLPEEVVLYIRKFLLPESRIDELLAKYPDYVDTLKKMSVAKLKTMFRKGVYNPYFLHLYSRLQNSERIKCIKPTLIITTTFKNRAHCANEIKRVFEAYRNAVPQSPEDHIYFQTKALKMLQAIVYVAYHRRNLR